MFCSSGHASRIQPPYLHAGPRRGPARSPRQNTSPSTHRTLRGWFTHASAGGPCPSAVRRPSPNSLLPLRSRLVPHLPSPPLVPSHRRTARHVARGARARQPYLTPRPGAPLPFLPVINNKQPNPQSRSPSHRSRRGESPGSRTESISRHQGQARSIHLSLFQPSFLFFVLGALISSLIRVQSDPIRPTNRCE